MKTKFHLLITLILTSVVLNAQIPNYSFETWNNMGTYVNPDQWGTLNDISAINNIFTATQATPGNPGSAYLKLTSKTTPAGVLNGIAVSGILDTNTMQPISGFAYNMRPSSLTGKWQHMIYGTSQGSIQVFLTRWDSGSNLRIPVASGNVTLSGMAMSWANFSIPLSYTDGNNPDSCIITLRASGNNPTNNDYLWVDNLTFNGTVTGIENHETILSGLSVYPNPAHETINISLHLKSEQIVTIELIDITGKIILSKDAGKLQGDSTQILNVTNISPGNYSVKVFSDSITEIRNIVIQ